MIALNLGSDTFMFDKELYTGSGRLLGLDITPNFFTESATVTASVKTLCSDIHTCRNCAISTSNQKNVPQLSINKATCKVDRVSIDITLVQSVSLAGAKFWLMIKDDFTDYVLSFFVNNKMDIPEKVMNWMHQIQKDTAITVNNIRCDKSSKNKALQQ
jgi:hypothetical protein